MGTTKERLSVIFFESDSLARNLEHNETHVTVKGGRQLVQNRFSKPLSATGELESIRITWKHIDGVDTNVIKPQMLDGLNIYTNGESHEFAITTPKYHYAHSNSLDFQLIKSFTHLDLQEFNFDWKERDYDILIGDYLRIDEYYTLDEGMEQSFGKDSQLDKMEAGFFFVESQSGLDTTLNGIRCMWNNDSSIETCQKTLLFYQRAHLTDNAQIAVDLIDPVGLHPTINIDLTSMSPARGCEYYAYMTLPLDIFVDKYQSSPIFVFGERDLELPEFKLKNSAWGSEALFQLKGGKQNEIKLHSRYVEPIEKGGYKNSNFDTLIFLACDSGNENVNENPFYSKGLGYESYFTQDTVFHHLNATKINFRIPTANANDYFLIQHTTIACIFFSVLYLLAKTFKADTR